MWQLLMTGNFQLGPAVIWEVVGLIANERMSSFDDKENSPGIYVTNEQCPTATQHVLVREETDSSSLPESLRRTRGSHHAATTYRAVGINGIVRPQPTVQPITHFIRRFEICNQHE